METAVAGSDRTHPPALPHPVRDLARDRATNPETTMNSASSLNRQAAEKFESVAPDDDRRVYDRIFWMAYVANVLLVSANALTFRFAELIAYLGGSEQLAGTIVGVGVCGALVGRLFLGQAIDRHGPRYLWMGFSALFVVGCLLFLACQRIGFELFMARIIFAVSVSAMFTCSIVHVQKRVPAHRRTEVIGNLGSSGFLGMISGALLGDLILNVFADTGHTKFLVLFGGAAILGLGYLTLVVLLTRQDCHEAPGDNPAAHRLLFRYWPGNILLVALMMGVSLTVTTVFLTRFATERSFSGIGPFFAAYAIAAFNFRILTRRWGETVGRHQMVIRGLLGHTIGHLSLLLVSSEWHLVWPAICCGFGHALLFPAVVSKGAGCFPIAYRGTGTTLILGFVDLGSALSAPALGSVIDSFGFPAMFCCSGCSALGVVAIYALTTARRPDLDHISDPAARTDFTIDVEPALVSARETRVESEPATA